MREGTHERAPTVLRDARLQRIRLSTVALPAEHGGWGLALEPILLGLVVAFSAAGAWLAVAGLFAFLVRWPLKVVVSGIRKGRTARVPLATGFLAAYGVAALSALTLAVWTSGTTVLAPLALALPAGFLFLVRDLRGQSRSMSAEVAGTLAFGAVPASIALADGWVPGMALALWALAACRTVPAVLYVRSRVRDIRGKPFPVVLPTVTHVAALGLVGGLASVGLTPKLAVAPYLILLARQVGGLSPRRRSITPRFLGFAEMGLGGLTILIIALAYATQGTVLAAP